MSKIHGMMDVGKRSMMNSQTALQTAGHNIANKSTEGFSRQRVEIQAADPVGYGKLRIGTGSKTAKVTRINNPYLEKQIGKETASRGFYQGQADALTRVEQVYNEQVNKGLNGLVNDMFNAFREFSNNPESMATRTMVKESAENLAKDFNRVVNQLGEIQRDVDIQVQTCVNDINEMCREVAILNEKIAFQQMQDGPANDERDRRDVLVKKIGEKVNIRWGEGKDGMVTITAGNTALLVAGVEAKKLSLAPTAETETKSAGSYDVFHHNSDQATPHKVTEQLTGGMIGGLLDVRDKTVIDLMGQMDRMAFTLSTVVNRVHSQGYDAYSEKGGEFFTTPTQLRHAARDMKVSEKVAGDVGRLAAGLEPHSPGDNRVAGTLAKLQFEGLFSEGTATVDEFYNSMVGQVGIQTRAANSSLKTQADVIAQLNNVRESISGVSLDEEATKLIEYQKAFDASARLIRTADEMFDTVLNLKRL